MCMSGLLSYNHSNVVIKLNIFTDYKDGQCLTLIRLYIEIEN